MKGFLKSNAMVLIWCAVAVLAGCAKKAEGPATAAETAAGAGAPAAPTEDLRGAFEAKVAEVDAYMKAHDVKNTAAEELAAKLGGFQKDFDGLAAKAVDDPESAARFKLAAEAMALYVKSLRAPAGDMSSLELAIDAEAKWTEAKKAAPAEAKP